MATKAPRRVRNLLRAAAAPLNAKNEATKRATLVELARVCLDVLDTKEHEEEKNEEEEEEEDDEILLNAFVGCVVEGEGSPLLALGIRCLLREYSKRTERGAQGVVGILFNCLKRLSSSTSTSSSSSTSRSVMYLVTGIQYCYLSRGWSSKNEEYPLLRVIKACPSNALESSVRFAVQMLVQVISSKTATNQLDDEKSAEKVKRLLTDFIGTFLPNLVVRESLHRLPSPAGNLVVFSLKQLLQVVRTRKSSSKSSSYLSSLARELISTRLMKVLIMMTSSSSSSFEEVAVILLDLFEDDDNDDDDGNHSSSSSSSSSMLLFCSSMETVLLQVCISRLVQGRPLTDIVPLLCRLYSKKPFHQERTGRVNCAHLAFLAMQDFLLEGDTLVSLFGKAMHPLDNHHKRHDTQNKAMIEIVALVTFVSKLKIGGGGGSLISMDTFWKSKDDSSPSYHQSSSTGCGYHSEGLLPLMMEQIIVHLATVSSVDDSLVYAKHFLHHITSMHPSEKNDQTTKQVVLCVTLSLLGHEDLRIKSECASKLLQICKAFPSFKEVFAVRAFLELKKLLHGGKGGRSHSTNTSHHHHHLLLLLKHILQFVLTCNNTPVTMALAKKALECMICCNYPRVYISALDCVAQVVEMDGIDIQCEDFLKILFRESQRMMTMSASKPMELRAIACCIKRVMKAFPRQSIEWINILDELLSSKDDIVKSLGIETVHHLCEFGVFNVQSAYRVIAKRMAGACSSSSSSSKVAWLKFQKLFLSEDMTEEEASEVLLRMEEIQEFEETFYDVLSVFPTEIIIYNNNIKGREHQRIATSNPGGAPLLFPRAEIFIAKVVAEEAKLLRHKGGANSGRGGGPSSSSIGGDQTRSAWNTTKRKLFSLGKRIHFNNLRRNVGVESDLAQMVWLASDARPSQHGLKHSLDEFSKLYQQLVSATFQLSWRLPNAFQMSESSWSAFMSSWLGASDANGDMNDRLDMVWRMIDSAEGGGTSDDCTSEWVAKAALIGCTQIADEQTHQLLPSLLSRVEDEHLSSQAKAASLLCLSLLVPGLVPRQDALMNAIVATISLQIDASSSSIVQRSCFEILGKIVYYMVKSNFPSADLVASTILCRFLDALRHIKEFALICTEIEQRLPSRWSTTTNNNNTNPISGGGGSSSSELAYGIVVGLGWMARAARKAKEGVFFDSIRKALLSCVQESSSSSRDTNTNMSLISLGIYSGSLMVVPSLLKDDETAEGALDNLLALLNDTWDKGLQDDSTMKVSYLYPVALCIGSLVSLLAAVRPPEDDTIRATVRKVCGCMVNENLPLNVRLGSIVASCNIIGCSMFAMPCHESFHKYVGLIDPTLVSDLLQSVVQVVTRDRNEPFLQSTMSWASQIIHYAMCNSMTSPSKDDKLLLASKFSKGSYIGMCVNQVEQYEAAMCANKVDSTSLTDAAVCALRCLKSVNDTETLDTIRLACSLMCKEIELKEKPSMNILEICYDVIASNKNTKDCLVSKDICKLVELFGDTPQKWDDFKVKQSFLSNLSSILAISDEEHVTRVLDALSKLKFEPREGQLLITLWKSLCAYVKRIAARKPRRYQSIRESLVSLAITHIQKTAVPTYRNVLNALLERDYLARSGTKLSSSPSEEEEGEEGEGEGEGEEKCVWFSVSTCMLEWQISDGEFNYAKDIASHVTEEKNLLVAMMIAKGKNVSLPDLIACQRWFLKQGHSAKSGWLVPTLTYHLVELFNSDRMDIKQWMLDIFEGETANTNALHLFSTVLLRSLPRNKIYSNAAMWIAHDFSLQMLPKSLPDILLSFPRSYCELFAQRFLRICMRAARQSEEIDILLSALFSIKQYFSIKDSDAFLEMI